MYPNIPLKATENKQASGKKSAFGYTLLRDLKSFTAAARLPALISTSTFLFSFSDCFSVPSPFAFVWLVALTSENVSTIPPLLGIVFASLMRFIWNITPDMTVIVGCIVVMVLRQKIKNGTLLFRMLITAAVLFPRLILAVFSQQFTNILLCGISVLIGIVALPAFLLCIRILSDKHETLKPEEKICTLMVGALLLAGAGHIELYVINLGVTFSLFLTLTTGYVIGSSAAVIMGLVCGGALSLCGFPGNIMVLFSVCGLCSGLMLKKEPRVLVCGLFVLGGTLVSLLTLPDRFVWLFQHILLVSIVFLPIKKQQLYRFESWVDQIRTPHSERENTYAAEMLKKWENAIVAITQALPMPDMPEDSPNTERIKHVLCHGCQQNDLCWQLNEETLNYVFTNLWEQLDNGQISVSAADLLGEGLCYREDDIIEIISALKNEQSLTFQKLVRAGYERDMIVTHLTAMAQAVKRLSVAAHGESLSDLKSSMDIEETLESLAFPGRLLYARRIDGRLRAAIEAEVIGFNRVSSDRIIDMLYRLKRLEMEVTLETRTRIEMEERPRYDIQAGHACLNCHDADTVNGDAVLLERLPNGKQLIMLSDGMGHGISAGAESQKTLELLKLCLEAGYTREQAITAVNGMMLSATGGDSFATVDLFIVDLWTGQCELSKLGACQSYFVRNDKIKSLSGVALPLGILERITPENMRLRLNDSDTLVLISDGVADSFVDEEQLKQHLSRSLFQEPQKSADAFLRSALISSGGIPRDDMSVLVIRMIARYTAKFTEQVLSSYTDDQPSAVQQEM